LNYSKLKFDIERSQLSYAELCRRISISYQGLNRSFQQETIRLNTFESICNELKLNPNDYFELGHLVNEELSISEQMKNIENLISALRSKIEQLEKTSK